MEEKFAEEEKPEPGMFIEEPPTIPDVDSYKWITDDQHLLARIEADLKNIDWRGNRLTFNIKQKDGTITQMYAPQSLNDIGVNSIMKSLRLVLSKNTKLSNSPTLQKAYDDVFELYYAKLIELLSNNALYGLNWNMLEDIMQTFMFAIIKAIEPSVGGDLLKRVTKTISSHEITRKDIMNEEKKKSLWDNMGGMKQ